VSQWNKLIDEIMRMNKNLRFEQLAKALSNIGYAESRPGGGSSHRIFRKEGKNPISLPKATPMKRAYIELVREALNESVNENREV